MKSVLVVLVFISAPAFASADDSKDRLCGTWAILPASAGAEFKWGPVPGVEVGCGRLRVNVIFVPSRSSQVIAVITGALTIVFK
jgi:hypothetical protein